MISPFAAAALSITVLSACTPPRAPDAPKAQRVTTYACDRGPMLVVHWPAAPDGPALKLYGNGAAPARTIVALYSLILRGYRPSEVLLFGEHQWGGEARELFAAAFERSRKAFHAGSMIHSGSESGPDHSATPCSASHSGDTATISPPNPPTARLVSSQSSNVTRSPASARRRSNTGHGNRHRCHRYEKRL